VEEAEEVEEDNFQHGNGLSKNRARLPQKLGAKTLKAGGPPVREETQPKAALLLPEEGTLDESL